MAIKWNSMTSPFIKRKCITSILKILTKFYRALNENLWTKLCSCNLKNDKKNLNKLRAQACIGQNQSKYFFN